MFKRFFDKEMVAALTTTFSFTIVVPLFIFFRSKDEYVRFWAAQSVIFFLIIFLIDSINFLFRGFNFLPAIIFLVTGLVWLTMVYKSWLGTYWRIPFVGGLARRVFKLQE